MTNLQPITHMFLINASDLSNIINSVFIVLPISHPSIPCITPWFLSLTIEGKWRYMHSGINCTQDERHNLAINTCSYLSLEDCASVIGEGLPPWQILKISCHLYWKWPHIICEDSYILRTNMWTSDTSLWGQRLVYGCCLGACTFPNQS